jgi:hypothetical protein
MDKKVIPGNKVGTEEKLMVSAEHQNGDAKDEPVRLEIAKALADTSCLIGSWNRVNTIMTKGSVASVY